MNTPQKNIAKALADCRATIRAQEQLISFIQEQCTPFDLVCSHPLLCEGLPVVHVYDLAQAKSVFGEDGWLMDNTPYKTMRKKVNGVCVSADFNAQAEQPVRLEPSDSAKPKS